MWATEAFRVVKRIVALGYYCTIPVHRKSVRFELAREGARWLAILEDEVNHEALLSGHGETPADALANLEHEVTQALRAYVEQYPTLVRNALDEAARDRETGTRVPV
jgi:hypothetical protein